MSSFDKYRVHELAKDFGMTSKAITEILTKYATTPKNHMQVLEDQELSLVFEYLTQQNQCASMEDLFKVPETPKPAPKKAEPAAQQAQAQQAAPQQERQQQAKPAQQPQPQAQQPQPAPAKEQKPHVPRQVPEKRVIDTRGGGNVNLGNMTSALTAWPARTRARTSSAARRSSRTSRSSASSRPRPAPSAAQKSASACRSCSSR